MADPLPPAGWHPDPEVAGSQRYWDGSRWTENRAPLPPKDKASGVLIGVSYAAALFLPIVGFILGLVLLIRRETAHGLAVFLISIAVVFVACQVFINDADDAVDRFNRSIQQDSRDANAYTRCLENNGYRFAACREFNPLK